MPQFVWKPTTYREQVVVRLPVSEATSITAPIPAGTAITALAVAPLPAALTAGTVLGVTDGNHELGVLQTVSGIEYFVGGAVVAAPGAALGATTIPINSITPAFGLFPGARVSWQKSDGRTVTVVPGQPVYVEPWELAAFTTYLQGLPGGGTVTTPTSMNS